jgi:hypothetical protein
MAAIISSALGNTSKEWYTIIVVAAADIINLNDDIDRREVSAVLAALNANDGWTEVVNSDGIQTLYRAEPGTMVHR